LFALAIGGATIIPWKIGGQARSLLPFCCTDFEPGGLPTLILRQRA